MKQHQIVYSGFREILYSNYNAFVLLIFYRRNVGKLERLVDMTGELVTHISSAVTFRIEILPSANLLPDIQP